MLTLGDRYDTFIAWGKASFSGTSKTNAPSAAKALCKRLEKHTKNIFDVDEYLTAKLCLCCGPMPDETALDEGQIRVPEKVAAQLDAMRQIKKDDVAGLSDSGTAIKASASTLTISPVTTEQD